MPTVVGGFVDVHLLLCLKIETCYIHITEYHQNLPKFQKFMNLSKHM